MDPSSRYSSADPVGSPAAQAARKEVSQAAKKQRAANEGANSVRRTYDEEHGDEGAREGPEVDRVVPPEEVHAHDRICEPRWREDRTPPVGEAAMAARAFAAKSRLSTHRFQ